MDTTERFLNPSEVVELERGPESFAALVISGPCDEGAFAWPDESNPNALWVRRVAVRCEVLPPLVGVDVRIDYEKLAEALIAARPTARALYGDVTIQGPPDEKDD